MNVFAIYAALDRGTSFIQFIPIIAAEQRVSARVGTAATLDCN
jgi:hypothetical protein